MSDAYVAGFAFDGLNRVWLIRKKRPSFQVGLLNGIGGKVEAMDYIADLKTTNEQNAMSREFHEEAGLLIEPDRWEHYHRETWPNGKVLDFFVTRLLPSEIPRAQTDEELVLLSWSCISALEWSTRGVMYNLCYLIPMAYVFLTVKPAELPYHKL